MSLDKNRGVELVLASTVLHYMQWHTFLVVPLDWNWIISQLPCKVLYQTWTAFLCDVRKSSLRRDMTLVKEGQRSFWFKVLNDSTFRVCIYAAVMRPESVTWVEARRLVNDSDFKTSIICEKLGRWWGCSLQHQHIKSSIKMEWGRNCKKQHNSRYVVVKSLGHQISFF